MIELPGWAQHFALIAGVEWPTGNEDEMWALGEDWRTASSSLEDIVSDIIDAKNASMEAYPQGDGVEQMVKAFDSLISGDGSESDQSVPKLAEYFQNIGDSAYATGTEIEYTKLMYISSLGLLAAEIALAWLWPPTAPLVQAAAIAVTRVAVRILGQRVVQAIARAMTKLIANRVVNFLLRHVAIDTIIGTMQEIGIQQYQVDAGHRKEIDWDQVAVTAVSSADGGAAAGPFADMFGRRLDNVLGGNGNPLSMPQQYLKAGVTGAGAGLVGAFAGMGAAIPTQIVASATGENAVSWGEAASQATSNLPSQFSPLMFSAGASNGMLTGLGKFGANHAYSSLGVGMYNPDHQAFTTRFNDVVGGSGPGIGGMPPGAGVSGDGAGGNSAVSQAPGAVNGAGEGNSTEPAAAGSPGEPPTGATGDGPSTTGDRLSAEGTDSGSAASGKSETGGDGDGSSTGDRTSETAHPSRSETDNSSQPRDSAGDTEGSGGETRAGLSEDSAPVRPKSAEDPNIAADRQDSAVDGNSGASRAEEGSSGLGDRSAETLGTGTDPVPRAESMTESIGPETAGNAAGPVATGAPLATGSPVAVGAAAATGSAPAAAAPPPGAGPSSTAPVNSSPADPRVPAATGESKPPAGGADGSTHRPKAGAERAGLGPRAPYPGTDGGIRADRTEAGVPGDDGADPTTGDRPEPARPVTRPNGSEAPLGPEDVVPVLPLAGLDPGADRPVGFREAGAPNEPRTTRTDGEQRIPAGDPQRSSENSATRPDEGRVSPEDRNRGECARLTLAEIQGETGNDRIAPPPDPVGPGGMTRSEVEAAANGRLHDYPAVGDDLPRHQGVADELLRMAAQLDPGEIAAGRGPRALVVDEYASPVDQHGVGAHAYSLTVRMDPQTGEFRIEVSDPAVGQRRGFPPDIPADLRAVSAILFDGAGNAVRPSPADIRVRPTNERYLNAGEQDYTANRRLDETPGEFSARTRAERADVGTGLEANRAQYLRARADALDAVGRPDDARSHRDLADLAETNAGRYRDEADRSWEVAGGRPEGDIGHRYPPLGPGPPFSDPDVQVGKPSPEQMFVGEDGRLHSDGDAPGTYRTADGLLHRPGDPDGSFRNEDNPDRWHYPDDPSNTYRTRYGLMDAETGRFHSQGGGDSYAFRAESGTSHRYPLADADSQDGRREAWQDALAARSEIEARRADLYAQLRGPAETFLQQARKYGIDTPLSGSENRGPYGSFADVIQLSKSKLAPELTRMRAAIAGDESLPVQERKELARALRKLESLSRKYHGLGEPLNTASKMLGESAGIAYALDTAARPDAALLAPFHGAFDGANVVDIAVLVPGVGDGPPKLVIVEAKGVTSGLQGARVFDPGTNQLVRAEQGTPEYLRRTLAIDQNLARILTETSDDMRARGLDPHGPEGRAVTRAREELLQAHRDGTLDIEYHLVKADKSGDATVSEFVLRPADRDPVAMNSIGGIDRDTRIGSRPSDPPPAGEPGRDGPQSGTGPHRDGPEATPLPRSETDDAARTAEAWRGLAEAEGARMVTDRVGLVEGDAPRIIVYGPQPDPADPRGYHDAGLADALRRSPAVAQAMVRPESRVEYRSVTPGRADDWRVEAMDPPQVQHLSSGWTDGRRLDITTWRDGDGTVHTVDPTRPSWTDNSGRDRAGEPTTDGLPDDERGPADSPPPKKFTFKDPPDGVSGWAMENVVNDMTLPADDVSAGQVPESSLPVNAPMAPQLYNTAGLSSDDVFTQHWGADSYNVVRLLLMAAEVPKLPSVRNWIQRHPEIGRWVLERPWLQSLPPFGTVFRDYEWFAPPERDVQPMHRGWEPSDHMTPEIPDGLRRQWDREAEQWREVQRWADAEYERFRADATDLDRIAEGIDRHRLAQQDAAARGVVDIVRDRLVEGLGGIDPNGDVPAQLDRIDTAITRVADELAHRFDSADTAAIRDTVGGIREMLLGVVDPDEIARGSDPSDIVRPLDRDVIADRLAPWMRDEVPEFSPEDLRRIKNHLMYDEHRVRDHSDPAGVFVMRPMDPLADVAEAWNRLQAGEPLPQDFVLLHGALAEARFLADHPLATWQQANLHAIERGHHWDADRPPLTDWRTGRQYSPDPVQTPPLLPPEPAPSPRPEGPDTRTPSGAPAAATRDGLPGEGADARDDAVTPRGSEAPPARSDDTALPDSGSGRAERSPAEGADSDVLGPDWFDRMELEQAEWEARMAAEHAAWLRETAAAYPDDHALRWRAEEAEWSARMDRERVDWLRRIHAADAVWRAESRAAQLRRVADADPENWAARQRAELAEWSARMAAQRAEWLHRMSGPGDDDPPDAPRSPEGPDDPDGSSPGSGAGPPPVRPPTASGTDGAAQGPAPAPAAHRSPDDGDASDSGGRGPDEPPPGGPIRPGDEAGGGRRFTGDPLRDLAAFLRAEAAEPGQLDTSPLSGSEAERLSRLAGALGLEAVFGELRDPANALAELAEVARAHGFLDDVENGPRMRYPADFAELTATQRYGDEEYWHNEADPELAREMRAELARAGLPVEDPTPPALPGTEAGPHRESREGQPGPERSPRIPGPEPVTVVPRVESAEATVEVLARAFGLDTAALTPEQLGAAISDLRYRILLRAGSIEALAAAVQRAADEPDPGARSQLGSTRDGWARRLGIDPEALVRDPDTALAEARARVVRQAGDTAALADAARTVHRVGEGEGGATRRYNVEIEGQWLGARLVESDDGSWRVEAAERLPAPVPERMPEPAAAEKSLPRRINEWLGKGFTGPAPKHPSGSGIDSAGQSMLGDAAGLPLRKVEDPTPAPGDEYEVITTEFSPARIIKESADLFRKREVLPLLNRLTARIADRSGEPDPPQTGDGPYRYWLDEADPERVRTELGVELDDLRQQLTADPGIRTEPGQDPAATSRPEPARGTDAGWQPRSAGEVAEWTTELSDAAAHRNTLFDELQAAAQDMGAQLDTATAEAVRALRDQLTYQQARRIGALTGLAEAARRFNAEHADIPYSDGISFFDSNPLGRFLREVVVARGGDPTMLDWRGVNNGGELGREWGDLPDGDQPGRDDGLRSFLERALRRDQIMDERAVWAQILGDIDLNRLDAENLSETLSGELARIETAAEQLTVVTERADAYLRADAEVAELTGLIGDMAVQEWVLEQGGAMFGDPAGLALVPGSGADAPMRLLVVDAGPEHDRMLAAALGRYPDLAAAVADGTVDVVYKVVDAAPDRITITDAGTPRVRHFAGDVEGRQLDITVVDDGSGWRLVSDEPIAADPDTGPRSTTEVTRDAADAARRLGLAPADLAEPGPLTDRLDTLRAANEIRAARIESMIDYARTAWDIDTYHDVEHARENLINRVDPDRSEPETPRHTAETIAHPDTPSARRRQQIDDLTAYAKALAPLDRTVVDAATERLQRQLDVLVDTMEVGGPDRIGDAIRNAVPRQGDDDRLVTALTEYLETLGGVDVFDARTHGQSAVDPRVGGRELPVHSAAVRHLVDLVADIGNLVDGPERLAMMAADTDRPPSADRGADADFARTIGVELPAADLQRWDDVLDRHRRGDIGDDDSELAAVRSELSRWNEVYDKYRDGKLDAHERLTPAQLAAVQRKLRAEVLQRATDIEAIAELIRGADPDEPAAPQDPLAAVRDELSVPNRAEAPPAVHEGPGHPERDGSGYRDGDTGVPPPDGPATRSGEDSTPPPDPGRRARANTTGPPPARGSTLRSHIPHPPHEWEPDMPPPYRYTEQPWPVPPDAVVEQPSSPEPPTPPEPPSDPPRQPAPEPQQPPEPRPPQLPDPPPRVPPSPPPVSDPDVPWVPPVPPPVSDPDVPWVPPVPPPVSDPDVPWVPPVPQPPESPPDSPVLPPRPVPPNFPAPPPVPPGPPADVPGPPGLPVPPPGDGLPVPPYPDGSSGSPGHPPGPRVPPADVPGSPGAGVPSPGNGAPLPPYPHGPTGPPGPPRHEYPGAPDVPPGRHRSPDIECPGPAPVPREPFDDPGVPSVPGGPGDPMLPPPVLPPPVPSGGGPQRPDQRYYCRGSNGSAAPGYTGPGSSAADAVLVVRPFSGPGVPAEFEPETGALRAGHGLTDAPRGVYGDLGGVPVVFYRRPDGLLALRIGDRGLVLGDRAQVSWERISARASRFVVTVAEAAPEELAYRALPVEMDLGAYIRDVLADAEYRNRVFT